ncbi:S8 family serine peptidase, partial [Candidatus Woesearchaeota archaeon]|nr:S8 family serine peptidase [Candidatus Woesearchaeota archaeon]
MDYQVNKLHAKILLGFLVVAVIFGYTLFSEYKYNPSNSIGSPAGYVVLEGTRVGTEKLDSSLVKVIQMGDYEPRVVVILEDTPETSSQNLEQKKQAIEEKQTEVIESLKEEIKVAESEDKKAIVTSTGIASTEEIEKELAQDKLPDAEELTQLQTADFEVTHKFDTINALAGKVNDPEALLELTKNKKVKKILLDYPVKVDLDQSVPRINANKAWEVSINGVNLTGAGETICIIDIGIDYSHPALGDCNPISYQLNGEPYNHSFDHTWRITLPNYTQIAVHFTNISLEMVSPGSDTLDRVYIYDKNNHTLAIYKGSLSNVWSPYGEGDTIYVRLASDSSVAEYGFFIDQVINGTTNTTMNWDSCPKVIGGWDTYNNDNDPRDDHGHGTHIAGIIASTNETYRGVAPQAQLVAIKALSASGSGRSSDIIAGIDWCIQNANKLNLSIISMSLGCDGTGCTHYQSYCNNDLTAAVINYSYQKNISVFIAAGNSGWTDGISNPSCVEHAIPVGAVNDADAILYNRGSLLSLLAPGTGIHSAALNWGWNSLSGTSMSTPHVSGAAALMHQYWKLAYGTIPSPDLIQNKLKLTGKRVYDESSGLIFSKVDVLGAIKPYLNFTNQTLTNGTSINNDYTDIEISSDVPLSSAILEWTSPNGTAANLSMITLSATGYYLNLTNLTNGTYSFRVCGNDSVGTEGVSESRIVLINTSITSGASTNQNSSSQPIPLVNFISPANNSYLTAYNLSTIIYNLTTLFGSKVLEYENSIINDYSFSITYLINLSANNLTDGNYTLTVFANDTSGSNITAKYRWTIDTNPPTILDINHTPPIGYNEKSVIFTANISDANLNLSKVYLSLNYTGNWSNYFMVVQNESSFSYAQNAINMTANLIIYYQIFAYDLAGNSNSSNVFNLTIIGINATNSTNATNTTNTTFSAVINITSPANGAVIEVG